MDSDGNQTFGDLRPAGYAFGDDPIVQTLDDDPAMIAPKADEQYGILKGTVLVIDDMPDAVKVVIGLAKAKGYGVVFRENSADALKAIKDGFRPEYVLCDVDLDNYDPGSGLTLARRINEICPDSTIFLNTGRDEEYGPELDSLVSNGVVYKAGGKPELPVSFVRGLPRLETASPESGYVSERSPRLTSVQPDGIEYRI